MENSFNSLADAFYQSYSWMFAADISLTVSLLWQEVVDRWYEAAGEKRHADTLPRHLAPGDNSSYLFKDKPPDSAVTPKQTQDLAQGTKLSVQLLRK